MRYNSLLHIRDARKHQMLKVGQIQQVLKKYGLQQVFLVQRLHKHFDLTEDEKVVWTYGEVKSYSQVRKGQDYSPCLFMFQQGEIYPIEYCVGHNLWQQIKSLQNFDKFKAQISNIIKGEQYIYGLSLKLTGYEYECQVTDEQKRTQQVFSVKGFGETDKQTAITKYSKGVKSYGACCMSVG